MTDWGVARPPAGWYPDPVTGTMRWWDGATWGDFASQHGYAPDPPRMPTPMPYANAWAAPVARQATNGLAIASMVLGILWLYWVGSVLAVIFGHVALSQIRRNGDNGRGMAIAGLVLGYIGLAVLAIVIVLAAAFSAGSSGTS